MLLRSVPESRNTYKETNSRALGSGLGTGDKASKRKDHRQALSNGTPKEQLASANSLNDEPGCRSEDGVDNHVYTTHQQRQIFIARRNASLEQNREIVDDSIAASHLLHQLTAGAKQHATEMLSLATSEEGLNWSALLAGETTGANRVQDDVSLDLSLGATKLIASESRDDFFSIFISFVGK